MTRPLMPPRVARRILVFVLAWAASSMPAGCTTPGQESDAVARLIDPQYRSKVRVDFGEPSILTIGTHETRGISTKEYPVATIKDDTRYVLIAPVKQVVVNTKKAHVAEFGNLKLQVSTTGLLSGARKIAVLPRVKVDANWIDGPTITVEANEQREDNNETVEITIPGVEPGKRVSVHAWGYAIPWKDETSYRTAPIRISEDAELEFGIGLLPASWGNGPVEFSIAACENSDCENIFAEILDPEDSRHRGWQDHTLSLKKFGGQQRTLSFLTKRLQPGKGTFSFPLWANPTIRRNPRDSAVAPNVILISIDTLSALHLSTYGYEHDTAPFVSDAFERRGVVFHDCVASATSTSPSHMSMFTGVDPSVHGVKTGLESLPSWFATLPEILRWNGIETGAITENGWLGIGHGFGRGFNTYVENKSANIMAPTGQVDTTFARAKEWLAHNRDRRFFLFLHTFQVHSPYAPPTKYQELFEPVPPNAPAYVRERIAYDQEIRYTDDELRMLFDTLEDLDLDRRTIVILTSDHGEAFAEHGFMEHGAHFHEAVTRVPLMFYGPGVDQGRRVNETVGHIDLLPTILDIFEIEGPTPTKGRSLTHLLTGKPNKGAEGERTYFTESWSPSAETADGKLIPFNPPAFNVRRGDLKLARYTTADGFEFELFDLASDPGETNNLTDDPDVAAAALYHVLAGYEQQSRAANKALREANRIATFAPDEQKPSMDPAREEKLRALGYIQ